MEMSVPVLAAKKTGEEEDPILATLNQTFSNPTTTVSVTKRRDIPMLIGKHTWDSSKLLLTSSFASVASLSSVDRNSHRQNGIESKIETRKPEGSFKSTASNLTALSAEKAKVRKEQNRLAAARSRKRRIDLETELKNKIQNLEHEKEVLQNELDECKDQKAHLEYGLISHMQVCSQSHEHFLGIMPSSMTSCSSPMSKF